MLILKVIVLLSVGVLAGFLSGFLGIGGGIVMVPALTFLLKFDMHLSVGSTLLAMVVLTTTGALSHLKNKEFNLKVWIALVAGGIPSAYLGSELAALAPSSYLSFVFGSILVVMGIWMALGIKTPNSETSEGGNILTKKYIILFGGAIGIGIMSALSGLGGGIFMVPLMVFLGLGHTVAVGTSLGVIVLTSLSASVGYVQHGNVDFMASFLLVISALVFTYIGANTTAKISRSRFKRIFGIITVVVGIRALLGVIF